MLFAGAHTTQPSKQAYARDVAVPGRALFDCNRAKLHKFHFLDRVPEIDMDKVNMTAGAYQTESLKDYQERFALCSSKFENYVLSDITSVSIQAMCYDSDIKFDQKVTLTQYGF
jgi:hypothetical protein